MALTDSARLLKPETRRKGGTEGTHDSEVFISIKTLLDTLQNSRTNSPQSSASSVPLRFKVFARTKMKFHNARKFCSSNRPDSVSTLSGWNCTPSTGKRR